MSQDIIQVRPPLPTLLYTVMQNKKNHDRCVIAVGFFWISCQGIFRSRLSIDNEMRQLRMGFNDNEEILSWSKIFVSLTIDSLRYIYQWRVPKLNKRLYEFVYIF